MGVYKNQKQRRAFFFLILALLCAVLWAPGAQAASGVFKKEISLYAGKTKKIKLKKAKKEVKWSSSKPSVVEIVSTEGNKVVIRARKGGKAVITGKVDHKEYKWKVTVPKPSYSLKVRKKAVSVMEGKTVTVKVKAKAKKAVAAVDAVSEKEQIASVSVSGKKLVITGREAGTTTVHVRFGNKKASVKVTVTDAPGKYRLALDVQEKIELAPTVTASVSDADEKYCFDITATVNGLDSYIYKGKGKPHIELEKISGPLKEETRRPRVSLTAKGKYQLCVSVPNYYAMMPAFASNGKTLVYRYRLAVCAGADRREKTITISISNTTPSSPAAQRFIAHLFEMDEIVRNDIAKGRQWTYKNKKTSELSRNFDDARKNNNLRTNCVTAIQWALLRSKAVDSNRDGIQWYGNRGIVWLNPRAEANAKKYFEIIPVGKSVKKCINEGLLKPGDILTYNSLAHTNVYLGNNLSFDSGHANCSGKGEGAKYVRWIGGTPYTGYKVAAILRLK